MVVFISSNLDVAKQLLVKVPEKIKGFEFCGIEAEWGDQCLEDGMQGLSKVFNHHIDSSKSPPCLAFESIYKDGNQIYKNENFIISHIDADTLFGIGWVSGIFKPTTQFKDLSKLVAMMDTQGYHNICQELKNKYIMEFEVIMGIVNHAKNAMKKIKYHKYYNCTTIIIKSLFKIQDLLNDHAALVKRYNLIKKEKTIHYNSGIEKLPESDKNIHIYKKKINDFNNGGHSFIISWNLTLSIYGRDTETVKKYIPEGLPSFLNNLFPDSGGQFAAAGTKRKTSIPYKQYLKCVEELKLRIEGVKGNGNNN